MSWAFACQVTGGGRGLRVTRDGEFVCEFAFGLPGDPVPGWEPDDEDALLTLADPFAARLRHLADEEGWTTVVSIDNGSEDERALPPLGVAVTVAPSWAGWSWTSDTEGFLVVAPSDGWAGEALMVQVRRGFWRVTQHSPVFASPRRRSEEVQRGVATFHLANPTGALRGHGRHQTTLEMSAIRSLQDAASAVPDWMPDLVVAENDELRFETPDQAVVPGPGVSMGTDDTAAVLMGSAGHREVAIHGLKGVQRVRATFTPEPSLFLADLATALKSTRPSALPTSTAVVIASGLARRATHDQAAVLDWLEREDWLARGDVFAPAVAAIVAAETLDEALLSAACEALLDADVVPGSGIIATRLWLATLRMGLPPVDLTSLFARVSADGLGGFEAAVLQNRDPGRWAPYALGLVNQLGGALPGQPVGLPEADAGLMIALLRLMPEGWPGRQAAAEASEKAARMLLADHQDGLHASYVGLAWMLLGEIGA